MKINWSLDLLYKEISFDNVITLKSELESFIKEPIESINFNTPYPMLKKIASVDIEIGFIKVIQITSDEIIQLCQHFINSKKNNEWIIEQNFVFLSDFCQKYSLESPDYECCQGYILNNEMINFGLLNNISEFHFKYKDAPYNTFLFYRLSFLHIQGEFLLVLRKIF